MPYVEYDEVEAICSGCGRAFRSEEALAEHQSAAGKAELLQCLGDDVERTLVFRGDARPADQLGGKGGRVEGGVPHSRSRSLIAVLARVCSSTVLTMTAQ